MNKTIKGIKNENKNDLIKWYLFLLLMAFLMAITNRFFISLAGTFSPGLAGIAQGIVYTTWNLLSDNSTLMGMSYSQFVNVFYSILYWILNIPVIIFAFKKLGVKFTSSSLFVLFTSLLFTTLLSISPWTNDIFTGELILSLKESTFEYSILLQYIVLISLGFFGGLLYGVACGFIYKTGTSTMGMDPISKYLEEEKKLNLNITIFLFSLFNSVFWIVIIGFTSGNIHSVEDFISNVIFSPTMFATILFLIGYLLSSNAIYPSNKKVMVQLNSTLNEISLDNLIDEIITDLITLGVKRVGVNTITFDLKDLNFIHDKLTKMEVDIEMIISNVTYKYLGV